MPGAVVTASWSATKISRAESGHESIPASEVEKLLDFYGVEDPLRARLLELAEDATQRGWWEDYADAVTAEYLEFIGLEAGAVSSLQWQTDVIPGLFQTEAYAKQLSAAWQTVVPTTPPSVADRFVRVRMRRQERLTHEPVLQLSVVLDEAVLLSERSIVGHCELDFARSEPDDFDAKRLHGALAGKARAHALGEMRIFRLKRHMG